MKKSNLQIILETYLAFQKLSYEYYNTHPKQARLRARSIAMSRVIISFGLLIQIASLNSEDVLTIIDHLIK